jgi:hypothetical protein
MCRNEWFLSLIERLNSTVKSCNILLTTNNTCTAHVPNLVTFEFLLFIKAQFITDAQNILHANQCTNGHVWSWASAPI